jgi:hypothetical protein
MCISVAAGQDYDQFQTTNADAYDLKTNIGNVICKAPEPHHSSTAALAARLVWTRSPGPL